MAAKGDAGEERGGGARVLAELPCAECGEMIDVGDDVVRVRGGTPVVEDPGQTPLPRVLHADCLPEDRA